MRAGSISGTTALAALAVAAVTAALAGCGIGRVPLPAPASRPVPSAAARPEGGDAAGPGGLRAGVGRADITPPPGVAIGLYGPDGGVARGWRGRLQARALVLRDGRGETVVLAAAEIGVAPEGLHREVARRVAERTGIGADRILLSATHTHAGPGDFYSWFTYNRHASGLPGYDPDLLAFLADGIAAAIVDALGAMRPAVAGWIQAPVWGATRNRSLPAFRANGQPDRVVPEIRPRPPPHLEAALAAVDPTWTLLRVDTIGPDGLPAPAGAWSAFAVHGTGNPPANDLFDPDVHGFAARGLEQHLAARLPPGAEPPVHAVAVAASGDVSPAGLHLDACDAAAARRPVRPGGPRTPPPLDVWETPSEAPGSSCQAVRRADTRATGSRLAEAAIDLHAAAGRGLRGDVTVGRAFRVVPLQGADAPPGLCPGPELGTPTGGGSEDGANALRDWKILGLFGTGTQEGATDPERTDCQAPKRRPPALLEAAVSPIVLPEIAQVAVVRVGDLLIGTLPAEPTTTVGLRARSALLRAAAGAGVPATGSVLVGLTNGYMQYVTTAEEYAVQHYEGSSTLYGPGSADALESELVRLAATLAAGGEGDVGPIEIRPGPVSRRLPAAEAPPAAGRFVEARCSGDTAIVRWRDGGPGALRPSDGPVIAVERDGRRSIEDGDPDLEVRHLGPLGGEHHLWEARYAPLDLPAAAATFRFRLPRRPAVPAEEVRCP